MGRSEGTVGTPMTPIRYLACFLLTATLAMRAAGNSAATQAAGAAAKAETPSPAKNLVPVADLRETDKPRNTIIRLPALVMQEQKLRKTPPIRESELMTPQAKIKMAYQQHPGLHVGNLPFFSNDGIAAAMYEEDKQLQRKREAYDL